MARHPASSEPEVELLELDGGDDDAAPEPEARTGRGTGWLAAGAGVVAILALAALTGRSDTTTGIVVPPTTAVRAPNVRQLPPEHAVLAADRRSVIASGGVWQEPIPIDPAHGEATSVAGGSGFVVAVVSTRDVIRWSDVEPSGERIAQGDLVLANPADPTMVWLVTDEDDGQTVRTVMAPPAQGSAPLPVPSGWRVAGAHANGLVLVRAGDGEGVALWDPWNGWNRGVKILDRQGRYLASSARRVAWLRGGQLVESKLPHMEERLVVLRAPVIAAAYAPDGMRLALIEEPGRAGTRIRFLEPDGTMHDGFVVLSNGGVSSWGWLADGDFVADPEGDIEYRFDPDWGLRISDRRRLG